MTKVPAMLEQLNALRMKAGKKPLKAWKGSVAQIKEQIEKFSRDLAPVTQAKPAVAKGAYKDKKQAARSIGKLKRKTKAQAPAKGEAKPANANVIRLADIAQEMNIDPKVARAKFRRLGEEAPVVAGDGWVFAPKQREEVMKALKSDRRVA